MSSDFSDFIVAFDAIATKVFPSYVGWSFYRSSKINAKKNNNFIV